MSIKKVVNILIMTSLSLMPLFAAGENMMSITIKKAQVRTSPSFLGKIIYNLSYGDRVEVYQERKGWYQIGSDQFNQKGWIHSSALVDKEIVLKSSGSSIDSNVSSSEVALAGKGFNEEVEAAYIDNNNMDYTWVNAMEEYAVETQDAIAFLEEGNIIPQEAR